MSIFKGYNAHMLRNPLSETCSNAGAYQRGETMQELEIGYLHHGDGTKGPFCTEVVKVKHEYADNYKAFFEGRWRKVHMQVKRCYIVFQGEKITIQIGGV